MKGMKFKYELNAELEYMRERYIVEVISEPYPVIGSGYHHATGNTNSHTSTHSTTCVVCKDTATGSLICDVPVTELQPLLED